MCVPVRRLLALVCLAVPAVACDNVGADRVLSVEATGTVNAFVFFDRNGNRQAEEAADSALAGVRVSLLARGTRDTAGTAVTDASGAVRLAALPVGTYDIVVDTATFGDSVMVVRQDSLSVTVPPADSVFFRVGVSFPIVSIADLRASALGRKVFIEGVALAPLGIFGDTTIYLADTSGVIRATRVRRADVLAGDSIRLLGVRGRRDGREVLDDATVFSIGLGSLPSAEVVTTGVAASADSGRLDAHLVRVRNVVIIDTATVAEDFVLTVDDSSGVLEIVLDDDAGLDTDPYEPGVEIDVVGLLVPRSADVWVLKPRDDRDVVVQ